MLFHFFFVTAVSTCEYKRRFCYDFFIALYFLVNIQMSVHILHEKNNTFLDCDEWNSILLLILCIHSCELIHFQRFSVALEYEKIAILGNSLYNWDPKDCQKKYQFISIIPFSIFRVLWYHHLHQLKLDLNEMILYTV